MTIPRVLTKESPVCTKDKVAVLWTQGRLGVSPPADNLHSLHVFCLFVLRRVVILC